MSSLKIGNIPHSSLYLQQPSTVFGSEQAINQVCWEFYHIVKEHLVLHNLFFSKAQKNKENFQTPVWCLYNIDTKSWKALHKKENYSPNELMHIHVKILHKIVATKIYQHIKITLYDQVEVISEI